jgi:hypothetical protein
VSKDDVFAICDGVAEARAILHDHLECGKHSPAEAQAKLHCVLSEDELLRALYDVGYFPRRRQPYRLSWPSQTAVSHERRMPG